MRAHLLTIHSRIVRAASRVTLRYRVVAVGLDRNDNIIRLATNLPLYADRRQRHAEERVIHESPRSLSRVLIARVGRRGTFLPIHPCAACARLAARRGVKIERWGV